MSAPRPDVAALGRALLTESLYALYPAARRAALPEPAAPRDPADPVTISGTAAALLDAFRRATAAAADAIALRAPDATIDERITAQRAAERRLVAYLAALEQAVAS